MPPKPLHIFIIIKFDKSTRNCDIVKNWTESQKQRRVRNMSGDNVETRIHDCLAGAGMEFN